MAPGPGLLRGRRNAGELWGLSENRAGAKPNSFESPLPYPPPNNFKVWIRQCNQLISNSEAREGWFLCSTFFLPKVCSIWLPVDPVSKHTCLRLVKGSHTWPDFFKPVHFDGPPFTSYGVQPGHEEQAKRFLPTPNVDGNKDYEVLSWDMEVYKTFSKIPLNIITNY